MLTRYLLMLLIFILSCASGPKRKEMKSTDAANLTQEEAIFRANRVSDVTYNLFFDLSKKDKSYAGTSKINFELKDIDSDLRIDFYAGKIYSLKINDKMRSPKYNKHYLLISKSHLKIGNNDIEIDFQHSFSRDGSGFYRFVDSEDNKIYTYTDLEPFGANKVFPCFDQPNLKATYTMKVLAPKTWNVVTSTLETKIIENKNGSRLWNFPTSQLFSTYIWALHAGPYHIFKDKYAKYPSRVFVRQSMKRYVKIKDWFNFTRQSFEFLDEYFGYPYPYKKYDQIIAPDFNAGAMENVAAVTFSENYVKRGEKTMALRRRHANVIFHEMAHMWFGNLVTMNWWNDLWLNESFATYAANLGLSRNSEFKNSAWQSFNGTKRWAYWEDQLVTTHPIEANVPDTSQAFANFDGITYGKGASSLKQIHFKLGEKGFKEGLQHYFKRHANTNTQLSDFMKSLEDGSGQDLKIWQQKWLQTTGVNTIGAQFLCQGNEITKFTIYQHSPENNQHIRPHSFMLSVFKQKEKGSKLALISTHKINLTTQFKEIKNLIGTPCPDAVYPNYEDHDYMRVKLDDITIKTLEKNISGISDNFQRQLFWTSLWDMVYYGQYSYKKFAKLLPQSLPNEKNFEILNFLIGTINGSRSNTSILYYAYHDINMGTAKRTELSNVYERMLWTMLTKSRPKSERQKILYNGYVSIVETKKELNRLHSILNSKVRIKGFKIDQDKRWSLIIKLASFNFKDINTVISKELEFDKSSLGVKMSIAAKAALPNWESKQKWLTEYLNPKSKYTYSQLQKAMYSLFPRHQIKLRKKYGLQFFTDIKKINAERENHVAKTFTILAPSFCSDEHQDELQDFLTEDNLKPGVFKKLRITRQETMRCQAVIKRANI